MITYASLHKTALIQNAMSVDVEDYFQTEGMSKAVSRDQWSQMPSRIERNTESLFELFETHGVRATFFFLGWVAERFPRLVRMARDLGHEIGCHSYWHRPLYSLTPGEFREDTYRAKTIIENTAGASVIGYRAPSFSLTDQTHWAPEILAEAGFLYDSSIHPIVSDMYDNHKAPRQPYQFSNAALIEIPISTVRIGNMNLPFGGGGYFRLFPYRYVRWAIKRVHDLERRATVFYIHPWEVDPEQLRLPASRRSRFRQYTGLSKTRGNLKRLFADFQFGPMAEAFSLELKDTNHKLLQISCNGQNMKFELG
jgi:polysaccharide deacetylase family protein (PEP-CTERM system associated)